ncbi:response regulator [Chitinophaga sp. Cy-1792]|uniref:response regulator n=1 Tax=Chitinophaga sp. Cy-1792 TaxID=2608339 RepID=UPI001F03A33B|nr:response regulator [Chitinophaga sp. Cy-1792]
MIADADETFANVVSAILQGVRFIPCTSTSIEYALQELQSSPYELVILDDYWEGYDILEIISRIKQQSSAAIVIISSALSNTAEAKYLEAGAMACVPKNEKDLSSLLIKIIAITANISSDLLAGS